MSCRVGVRFEMEGRRAMKRLALSLPALLTAGSPARAQHYDVLIRGGTVDDGSDTPGRTADVAIASDRIAAVGTIPAAATATTLLDASGKIVAPGSIDPPSPAATTLHTAKLAAALPMPHHAIPPLTIGEAQGGGRVCT